MLVLKQLPCMANQKIADGHRAALLPSHRRQKSAGPASVFVSPVYRTMQSTNGQHATLYEELEALLTKAGAILAAERAAHVPSVVMLTLEALASAA